MSDGTPLIQDAFLRRKARDAVRFRTLPARSPDRIWGGMGSGARCCICETSIGQDQTELELEFTEDRSKSNYHIVHLRCFSVFEIERQLAVPQENLTTGRTAPPGSQDLLEAT